MDLNKLEFRLERHCTIDNNLWASYVDIRYGRAVPHKEYKGYRTYLKDVTRAKVNGTVLNGFYLTFRTQKDLTWFLLRFN